MEDKYSITEPIMFAKLIEFKRICEESLCFQNNDQPPIDITDADLYITKLWEKYITEQDLIVKNKLHDKLIKSINYWIGLVQRFENEVDLRTMYIKLIEFNKIREKVMESSKYNEDIVFIMRLVDMDSIITQKWEDYIIEHDHWKKDEIYKSFIKSIEYFTVVFQRILEDEIAINDLTEALQNHGSFFMNNV